MESKVCRQSIRRSSISGEVGGGGDAAKVVG